MKPRALILNFKNKVWEKLYINQRKYKLLLYRLHKVLFKSRILEKVKKLNTLLNWQGIWGHTSPYASKRKQWNDSSSVWREVVNDSLFLYDFNSWQKTGLLVASWQIYHYLLALSWLNWEKKNTSSFENPITFWNFGHYFWDRCE